MQESITETARPTKRVSMQESIAETARPTKRVSMQESTANGTCELLIHFP